MPGLPSLIGSVSLLDKVAEDGFIKSFNESDSKALSSALTCSPAHHSRTISVTFSIDCLHFAAALQLRLGMLWQGNDAGGDDGVGDARALAVGHGVGCRAERAGRSEESCSPDEPRGHPFGAGVRGERGGDGGVHQGGSAAGALLPLSASACTGPDSAHTLLPDPDPPRQRCDHRADWLVASRLW
eukprot:2780591-Rhodomonas_salina.1